MLLTRLTYTSMVSDNFLPNDIENILTTARKNNADSHVSGILCFNNKYFLQCLEGSRAEVNRIYNKILNDPRHTDVLILDYQEISEREFSEWSMGYMPETALTAPLNLRFSGYPEFNPYTMTGESAHRMMLAFKDCVPSVQ